MSYFVRFAQAVNTLIFLVGLPMVLFANNYKNECEALKDIEQRKSIDASIQTTAKRLLDESVETTKASYGEYVLLEANSGKILSHYNTGSPDACATSKWEPGSVIKPLTVAVALNEQVIDKNFIFFDNGSVLVAGSQISNWAEFPKETKNLETLLHDSLNVGAVTVLDELRDKGFDGQRDVWSSYLKSTFRIVDEGKNSSPPYLKDADYRYAISSFGLGVVTTPVQLSLAYAALVNGGSYYNECYEHICSVNGEYAINDSVSAEIKRLLTTIYKTYRPANLQNEYHVGGKSGSSPLALPDGRYLKDRESGTFVGYISKGEKTYIQLVRLDEPKNYPLVSQSSKEVWGNIVVDLSNAHLL